MNTSGKSTEGLSKSIREQCAKLQEELRTLKTQENDVKNEVVMLRTVIEAKEQRMRTLEYMHKGENRQQDISRRSDVHAQHSTATTAATTAAAEAHAQIDELNTIVAALEADAVRLRDEVEAGKSACAEARKERDRLHNEADKARSEYERAWQILNDLNNKIKDKENRLNVMDVRVNSSMTAATQKIVVAVEEQRLLELRADVASQQDLLQTLRQQHLEMQRTAWEGNLRKRNAVRDASVCTDDDMQVLFEAAGGGEEMDMHTQETSIDDELQECAAEIASVSDSLSRSKTSWQITMASKSIARPTEQEMCPHNVLAAVQGGAEKAARSIHRHGDDEKQSTLHQRNEQVGIHSHREIGQDVDASANRKADLQLKHSKQTQQAGGVETQLEQARRELSEAQGQLSSMKGQLAATSATINMSNTQIAEKRAELRRIESECHTAEEKLAELCMAAAAAQAAQGAAAADIEDLIVEVEEAKKDLVTLREEANSIDRDRDDDVAALDSCAELLRDNIGIENNAQSHSFSAWSAHSHSHASSSSENTDRDVVQLQETVRSLSEQLAIAKHGVEVLETQAHKALQDNEETSGADSTGKSDMMHVHDMKARIEALESQLAIERLEKEQLQDSSIVRERLAEDLESIQRSRHGELVTTSSLQNADGMMQHSEAHLEPTALAELQELHRTVVELAMQLSSLERGSVNIDSEPQLYVHDMETSELCVSPIKKKGTGLDVHPETDAVEDVSHAVHDLGTARVSKVHDSGLEGSAAIQPSYSKQRNVYPRAETGVDHEKQLLLSSINELKSAKRKHAALVSELHENESELQDLNRAVARLGQQLAGERAKVTDVSDTVLILDTLCVRVCGVQVADVSGTMR